MTVHELIEWLKTQDQGAVVEIVSGDEYVTFSPEHSYYIDLRKNPFVSEDSPIKQIRFLEFGERG